MDKTGEEVLEKTDLRTLWSETLLEMLNEAIENHWSDHALREIVGELRQKGYSGKQLAKLIEKRFGPDTANDFKSRINRPGRGEQAGRD